MFLLGEPQPSEVSLPPLSLSFSLSTAPSSSLSPHSLHCYHVSDCGTSLLINRWAGAARPLMAPPDTQSLSQKQCHSHPELLSHLSLVSWDPFFFVPLTMSLPLWEKCKEVCLLPERPETSSSHLLRDSWTHSLEYLQPAIPPSTSFLLSLATGPKVSPSGWLFTYTVTKELWASLPLTKLLLFPSLHSAYPSPLELHSMVKSLSSTIMWLMGPFLHLLRLSESWPIPTRTTASVL